MLKILKNNELNGEVAVVVGTRPGIIKFSPVIRELEAQQVPYFIIHTGQHYSYNMDKQFFDDLELPTPMYTNDKVAKETYHGAQTAEMIRGVENALLDSKPKVVIVGGDANTNLAGALATRKLGIILAHMEAGLRSDDWRMPEEHNRIIIDHISEILFAPTDLCIENIKRDNVKGKIYKTGNTIVDAVMKNMELSKKKSNILDKIDIKKDKPYYLLTFHREENVDNEEILKCLIDNLKKVFNKIKARIIFPMHPRTKKRINEFQLNSKIEKINNLTIIEPVGYLDMLALMNNADMVLTDSGGIQEETCILQVPCITLRENTERPETVEVGANKIVGTDEKKMIDAMEYFNSLSEKRWNNPYGDGKAAEKIVKVLSNVITGKDSVSIC